MQPFTEIVKKILAADLTDGAKLAALAYEVGAQNAREASEVCKKSIRTMERHFADMRVWREKHRNSAEDTEKPPQICGGGYADLRTDDLAPTRENNSARDYIENPTGLSLSQEVQQQPACENVEAGLLSLLKSEWNLYTDGEAKTALLSEFRIYGEKHVLDAYSNFLAEKQAKRPIVKPWKFIQATARGLRDAPPKPVNVVAMAPRQTERSQRSAAFMAALKAPRVEVLS